MVYNAVGIPNTWFIEVITITSHDNVIIQYEDDTKEVIDGIYMEHLCGNGTFTKEYVGDDIKWLDDYRFIIYLNGENIEGEEGEEDYVYESDEEYEDIEEEEEPTSVMDLKFLE
jgi:hypothetical protein